MQSQNVQDLYNQVFQENKIDWSDTNLVTPMSRTQFTLPNNSILNSMLKNGMDTSWQSQGTYNVLNNLNVPSQLTNSMNFGRANSSGGLLSNVKSNLSSFKEDHPILWNVGKYGLLAAGTALTGGLGGVVAGGALVKDVYDKVKGKTEETPTSQQTEKTNQPQVTNTSQVTNNNIQKTLASDLNRQTAANRIISGGSSVINMPNGNNFASLVNVAGLGRI